MKILLVTNKTYRGHLDGGWWYFYLPLVELGHDVQFYDTVSTEQSFEKVIENFKPDLVFSMLTNNRIIAPGEPWEEIRWETKSGRTKTFNWFCDDTWRYDNFSRGACKIFTACSTPEPEYIKKYKEDGYQNIILGTWHSNINLYPKFDYTDKDIDISFIGAITGLRKHFFESTKETPVHIFSNISQEEMYATHCRSKIAVNLSFNQNDPQAKTQMKQRMFEAPAAQALLLTQYHPGIENFFEIDKEIVTFSSDEEFCEKANFLISKPKLLKSLAISGFKRFMAEHESKIRLTNVLKEIMAI